MQELKEKYDLNTNFLEYLQLKFNIPFKWRKIITSNVGSKLVTSEPILHVKIGENNIPLKYTISKDIYWLYVETQKQTPSCI